MAEAAIDVTESKVRTYDVFIETDGSMVNVGWCEEPEASVEQDRREIALSQLHRQVLGQRLLGIKATAKATLKQHTLANQKRMFPWHSAGDVVPFAPAALGVDTYTYAKAVVFHPRDKGAGLAYMATGEGYDNAEDWAFLKGVVVSPAQLSADGETEAQIPLEWEFYPDRAQLPDIVLGDVGGEITLA